MAGRFAMRNRMKEVCFRFDDCSLEFCSSTVSSVGFLMKKDRGIQMKQRPARILGTNDHPYVVDTFCIRNGKTREICQKYPEEVK